MTSSQAANERDSIQRLHSLVHESRRLLVDLSHPSDPAYLDGTSPIRALYTLLYQMETLIEGMKTKTIR
jgi:hypothetical protein